MKAIPLAAPDGTVFAYACGVCNRVRAGSHKMVRHTRADVRSFADSYREEADDCCKCRRCGKQINTRGISFVCKKCEPAEEAERAANQAEFAEKQQVTNAVLDKALAKSLDRACALALRDLMSGISEDYYCAGWLTGLERTLWGMLQGDSRHFGMGEVTHEEIGRLRDLHEKCGGWWYFDDERGEEMFLATAEWIARLTTKAA